MRTLVIAATSLLCLAASFPAAPGAPPPYVVSGSIAGPDGAGWDYAGVDPAKRLLYVARGDFVVEVDLAHGDAVRRIGSIAHGHAVLPVPGTDVLLVTSGGDDTVRLLDQRSGAQIASLKVGGDPDAAVLDASTGHVLVMNAHGGSVSDIDVAGRRVARTIALKPGLEEAAIGRGRTLYVNDEDAGEIEVVDLASGRVGAPIALTGCEGPTGLAYDAAGDRLVSACANGKAVVVDARTRRLTSLVDIGGGPDGAMIDPGRRVVLIPCGRDGVLEVLKLGPTVTREATIRTETGARTGTLDPRTGAAYLPTARFGPPAPGAKRAPALPGTFHLVVVRPR